MAALLPILQEILPMLMPGPVQIVRAEDVGRKEEGEEGDEEDDEVLNEEEKGPVEDERALGEEREGERGERREENDGEEALIERDGHDDSPQSTARRNDNADNPPRRIRAPRPPRNGVSLRDAVVNKSSTLCASVLTVQPGCATVVFHNGEQEALVYAVQGSAVLATLPEEDDDERRGEGEDDEDDEDGIAIEYDADEAAASSTSKNDPTTHAVRPGDFALIPAWTEHQVRNVGDGDVVWVVVRNGAEPTVVPLRGWGGEQMEG